MKEEEKGKVSDLIDWEIGGLRWGVVSFDEDRRTSTLVPLQSVELREAQQGRREEKEGSRIAKKLLSSGAPFPPSSPSLSRAQQAHERSSRGSSSLSRALQTSDRERKEQSRISNENLSSNLAPSFLPSSP